MNGGTETYLHRVAAHLVTEAGWQHVDLAEAAPAGMLLLDGGTTGVVLCAGEGREVGELAAWSHRWYDLLRQGKLPKAWTRLVFVMAFAGEAPKGWQRLSHKPFVGRSLQAAVVEQVLPGTGGQGGRVSGLDRLADGTLRGALQKAWEQHAAGGEAVDLAHVVARESGRVQEFEEALAQTTPWATWALLATCLLMFGAATLAGGTDSIAVLLRFGADQGHLVRGGEWWRPVGSMFMHIGFVHLAVNMYSLVVVGPTLERFLGHARYLALYAVSGLAGSLASNLWNPDIVGAGASGALFGLFGASAWLGWVGRESIPGRIRQRLAGGMAPAILYNLLYGFSRTGINNAAHLGGLAGGLLFAALLVPKGPNVLPERPRGATLALLAALGALLFLTEAWVAARAWTHPAALPSASQAVDDPSGRLLYEVPVGLVPHETEDGTTFLRGPGLAVAVEAADLEGETLDPRADLDRLAGELKENGYGVQGQEVVEEGGRAWAVVRTKLPDGTEMHFAFGTVGSQLCTVMAAAGDEALARDLLLRVLRSVKPKP